MKAGDYLWVVYPVLVVAFIVLSLTVVTGQGQAGWDALTNRQKEVALQSERLARLKLKVGKLRETRAEEVNEDLRNLLLAVPATRQVLLLLSELGQAASGSGLSMEGYSFDTGNIKESTPSAQGSEEEAKKELVVNVVVEGGNFDRLRQFVGKLEGFLPIARVTGVKFADGGAAVKVEQKWKPWVKVNLEAESELPEYAAKLAEAFKLISEYEQISGDLEGASSASAEVGTTNPF